MKKRIGRALGMWVLMLAFLGVAVLWTGSRMILVGGCVWFVIPFAGTALNLYLRNRIHVVVQLPAAAAKKEKVTGFVTIQNASRLAATGVCCEITIENHLTDEKEQVLLTFGGMSAVESAMQFEVVSEHCGYLQAYATGIWLMDWIGFLPLRCRKAEQEARETSNRRNGEAVLPDTFQPHIYMNMAQVVQEDADSWSQTRKGNDLSEIFALRDYVPGDSLKQIHWKLSSKRGQMIVREPSLPVEKSLLLLWDKNTEAASPAEMDAMAECAASVSQGILNLGYRFTLAWTEGQSLAMEQIEQEDVLLQTIPRMVKHGAQIAEDAESYLNELTEKAGYFGKVIYIARTLREDISSFPCADMTCLLCDDAYTAEEQHIVSFRAEHYREDLSAIEL